VSSLILMLYALTSRINVVSELGYFLTGVLRPACWMCDDVYCLLLLALTYFGVVWYWMYHGGSARATHARRVQSGGSPHPHQQDVEVR
jgi:hypothetical protein